MTQLEELQKRIEGLAHVLEYHCHPGGFNIDALGLDDELYEELRRCSEPLAVTPEGPKTKE